MGPGYACLGISPAIAPVAGGTEVTISGLRFRWAVLQWGRPVALAVPIYVALCDKQPAPTVALRCRDGKVRVRLTSARDEVVVDGTYVSSETVRFVTPPHEQHGPLPCDVAVAIGSGSWTVTPLKFQVGP